MLLPEPLITSLHHTAGVDESAFRAVHDTREQVVSVRWNTHKSGRDQFSGVAGVPFTKEIPWSRNGFYLPKRPAFFLDPLWHAGAYYVQDASSMSLEFALRHCCDLSRPLRVLDLCAAPGGKSTLIADLLSPESILVSNEVIASRVPILEENMVKWGMPNTVITQNDARDVGKLENFFDVIVVDAPCSGSGLFRKDPDAVKEWSPEQVSLCHKRQERILNDVMPALKEQGILMYATCSFSPEEDEQIVDYLMQGFALESVKLAFNPGWNITESISPESGGCGYRFYPDKLAGEGFFLACFRNTENRKVNRGEAGKKKSKQQFLSKLSREQENVIKPWVSGAHEASWYSWKNQVWAIPEFMENDLQVLLSRLRVRYADVNAGRLIRDQLIPDHSLAMSILVNKEELMVNLPIEEAIKYLRKETIVIPEGLKGWKLVAYNDYPLGWIKVMGNRINNYYPTQWRIRKPG